MKAIILAGGRGTRLQPLTNDIPKPLVNIIDKPVMEHIINLLVTHGITEIGVTLGYMAEKITSYFGDGKALGAKLTYFIEKEPLGTAGSVKGAESYLSDTFLVISGDAYTNMNLTRLINYHQAKKSPLTLVCTPMSNPKGLGTLEVDFDGRVVRFEEKPLRPKPSLVNCGIYCIDKKVLKLIPKSFYDFGKELLPRLVGEIFGYVTYDYWSDIGTLPSYYYTNYLVSSSMQPQL